MTDIGVPASGFSAKAGAATAQLGGTDNLPTGSARAKLADTARLAPRPANCGVGTRLRRSQPLCPLGRRSAAVRSR
ncbi:Uncharacterised protein [Mycobacterium tuberculosis]|nr:Uncharacterised protein [Mycobacterium tuberculosis]